MLKDKPVLTGKQRKALEALLTWPTKSAAAAAAGISERTLRSYFTDQRFQEAYNSAVDDLVRDAARQAQGALAPSLAALRSIVEDQEASTSSRIAAARSLVEYGMKFTELVDIEKRLKALEDAVKNDSINRR